jgi:hypothetical protein
MLDAPVGLDPTEGDAAAAHRHQAPPTFVLAPHAHGAALPGRKRLLHLRDQGLPKRRLGIRVFLYGAGAPPWDWS